MPLRLSGQVEHRCDEPKDYGLYKTLYNRWKRWDERGIFLRMMEGLAAAEAVPKTVMIEATYLKAHRTASCLPLKRDLGRLIGRTNGGMNTKLLSVSDADAGP